MVNFVEQYLLKYTYIFIIMKYYKNYVLKKLNKQQIESNKNIFINGEPLIIQYEYNTTYYWYRIN